MRKAKAPPPSYENLLNILLLVDYFTIVYNGPYHNKKNAHLRYEDFIDLLKEMLKGNSSEQQTLQHNKKFTTHVPGGTQRYHNLRYLAVNNFNKLTAEDQKDLRESLRQMLDASAVSPLPDNVKAAFSSIQMLRKYLLLLPTLKKLRSAVYLSEAERLLNNPSLTNEILLKKEPFHLQPTRLHFLLSIKLEDLSDKDNGIGYQNALTQSILPSLASNVASEDTPYSTKLIFTPNIIQLMLENDYFNLLFWLTLCIKNKELREHLLPILFNKENNSNLYKRLIDWLYRQLNVKTNTQLTGHQELVFYPFLVLCLLYEIYLDKQSKTTSVLSTCSDDIASTSSNISHQPQVSSPRPLSFVANIVLRKYISEQWGVGLSFPESLLSSFKRNTNNQLHETVLSYTTAFSVVLHIQQLFLYFTEQNTKQNFIFRHNRQDWKAKMRDLAKLIVNIENEVDIKIGLTTFFETMPDLLYQKNIGAFIHYYNSCSEDERNLMPQMIRAYLNTPGSLVEYCSLPTNERPEQEIKSHVDRVRALPYSRVAQLEKNTLIDLYGMEYLKSRLAFEALKTRGRIQKDTLNNKASWTSDNFLFSKPAMNILLLREAIKNPNKFGIGKKNGYANFHPCQFAMFQFFRLLNYICNDYTNPNSDLNSSLDDTTQQHLNQTLRFMFRPSWVTDLVRNINALQKDSLPKRYINHITDLTTAISRISDSDDLAIFQAQAYWFVTNRKDFFLLKDEIYFHRWNTHFLSAFNDHLLTPASKQPTVSGQPDKPSPTKSRGPGFQYASENSKRKSQPAPSLPKKRMPKSFSLHNDL